MQKSDTIGAVSTIQDQPNDMMSIMRQALMSPDVSIEKFNRLVDIQEKIKRINAETEFNIALVEMQPNLPSVEKNGAIKFTDKNNNIQNTPYAKYEDIMEAIKPFLSEHGFALSFSSEREGDRVIIIGKLSHRAGHSEKVVIPIPLDTTGSKNKVQAIGSSLTYGKRYAVGLLLNIVTKGMDNDGGGQDDTPTITQQQAQTLIDYGEGGFLKINALVTSHKRQNVYDLSPAEYEAALKVAKDREAKGGK